MNKYQMDKSRYSNGKMPTFQKYFRKYQDTNNKILKIIYKILFVINRNLNHIEISSNLEIGGGVICWTPLLYND